MGSLVARNGRALAPFLHHLSEVRADSLVSERLSRAGGSSVDATGGKRSAHWNHRSRRRAVCLQVPESPLPNLELYGSPRRVLRFLAELEDAEESPWSELLVTSFVVGWQSPDSLQRAGTIKGTLERLHHRGAGAKAGAAESAATTARRVATVTTRRYEIHGW